MKNEAIADLEVYLDRVRLLSCLLLFGGTTLLASLFCLAAHRFFPVSGAVFSAAAALDALLLRRVKKPERVHYALFSLAILVCMPCMLLCGQSVVFSPLWLLLPVCAPFLLGLRRGCLLSLLVPVEGALVLVLSAAPRDALSPSSLTLYGVFLLVGILLERLYSLAAARYIRQRSALETLSRMDTLTGICNRWWYSEQLQTRSGQPEYRRRYAVLLIDVDNFKTINDTHGHLCGDRVLISIARIIEDAFRKDGIVCRWGGDEFLCQMRAASAEETLSRAEETRRAIASFPFRTADGQALRVTASIGAVYVPNPQSTYSAELFTLADQALYEAKNSGRNRVSFRTTAPAASGET